MVFSAQARQGEALLIRIHRALREDDADEIEILNEAFTDVAMRLSIFETETLNGLSADLYSIAGKESRFSMARLGLATNDPVTALKTALTERRWTTILRILRANETLLAEDRRAYIRATTYERLGLIEASGSFYRLATDLAPGNADYRYLNLATLIENAPGQALSLANQILVSDREAWTTLALAYWVQIRDRAVRRGEIETQLLREATRKVEERIPVDALRQEDPTLAGATMLLLGYWYELLGMEAEAKGRYLDATLIDPDNRDAFDLLHGTPVVLTGGRERDTERAEQAIHRRLNRELAFAA